MQKKRGIDGKWIREGSIPPSSSNILHQLFLGKPALSQWPHLPSHKVFHHVSFVAFFGCPMGKWLSMLPYQRLPVFLLRNHKPQDSRCFVSSLFLLAPPKSVLHLPINPQLFRSKCLDWGIVLCLWVTLEEMILKQTAEWCKQRPGAIRKGADGSFWGTSEANVLDVKDSARISCSVCY